MYRIVGSLTDILGSSHSATPCFEAPGKPQQGVIQNEDYQATRRLLRSRRLRLLKATLEDDEEQVKVMEPLVRSALSEWKGVLNRRWRDGSLLLQPVDDEGHIARWLKVPEERAEGLSVYELTVCWGLGLFTLQEDLLELRAEYGGPPLEGMLGANGTNCLEGPGRYMQASTRGKYGVQNKDYAPPSHIKQRHRHSYPRLPRGVSRRRRRQDSGSRLRC